MKKEIADKWVEALRSGKYKQGIGVLKSGDRFCCLGVLCDISGLSEWKDDQYFEACIYLPEAVMDWAEMQSYSGSFNDNNLSELNDDNYSFEKIADEIEKHWKDL